MLNKIFLFIIYIRQKIFSSHTWILRNLLYTGKVCSHFPHCSEYWKQCFERYNFLDALKYTMTRIWNCKPSNKIKYDPAFYKVVFFSSSNIWLSFFKKLLDDKRFDVVWIVTMPDAPFWRWKKLKENIVAEEFKKLNQNNFENKEKYIDDLNEIEEIALNGKKIKIFKPKKIKNNDVFYNELKSLNSDYFVVISYWKILPKSILNIPKIWPINIHWSILPKYRWASPIQSVFLNKEKETWITIMYMNEKMDEWDIIKILKFSLTKNDNSKTVIEKFNKFWPSFVADTLWDFAKWKLKRIKQDLNSVTYCGKFEKKDWKISFQNETAESIYSKFQAFYLWPWIYTYWNWKLLKFTAIDIEEWNLQQWKVVFDNWILKIWTKKWNIIVKKVKLEWKKEMTASEFINWYKGFLWTILE